MALQNALRVLVANRGEIAARIIKTCTALGIDSVAVYTDVDVLSLHETLATESVCLGDNPRAYTDGELLIKIAKDKGCCALHPGYGFLSENIEFAEACEVAGITFIGPNTGANAVDAMKIFSEKHTAKAHAVSAGIPTLPGSSLLATVEEALGAAKLVSLPVLLKATGGGGGMGIYLCRTEQDVEDHFHTAANQAKAFFGIEGVFVEKYIERAHHIEVQVFGDGRGNVIHIGERECSIQRRHQKILEETPSPLIDEELRQDLTKSAVRLCSTVNYRSAGTVEFLVDAETKKFYFLEVNTRLQVEHGITELVNGNIDLVEWMLRLQLPVSKESEFGPERDLVQFQHAPQGHSIEVRLCAENPLKDFMPSPGLLGLVEFPEGPGIRVDSWVSTGTEVSGMYDSLLAKIMVWAPTRQGAIHAMEKALTQTQIKGIPTNLEFLHEVVVSSNFKAGDTTTTFLKAFDFVSHSIEVVSPGMLTTVQDYPGRVKLWHVGVPPSGPMDSHSFRLANSLVGNDENAAGLEITFRGPTLLFRCDSLVAVAGAPISLSLDGENVPMWTSFRILKGQSLTISDVIGQFGARSYLAIYGGIAVPDYLHSKSTFIGGKFGGVQGRALCTGDMLPITPLPEQIDSGFSLPEEWRPEIVGGDTAWEVEVLPGPYAAPDYFTEEDIAMLYSSNFTVHYNSNRLGIRLHGPKPQWARKDGGEGGSHPSNIHDYTYAIGAVNFTGDMPIVLGVDGPSLGGFVCPCVVLTTELWKMGQVRANDNIVWKKVALEHAYIKQRVTDLKMDLVRKCARGETSWKFAEKELQNATFESPKMPETKAVIKDIPPSGTHPGGKYRLSGDRFVLVEYGPVELDLNFRVRAHMLEKALHAQAIDGLVETNPGVRSLLIEYDPVALPFPELIKLLDSTDSSLPDAHDFECPSRIIHLPLAFNEKWTHEAIQKYSQSVRKEATYIPSNIEFIAKNNGLEGIQPVEDILFSSSYLVLGLGDVYLGACCAVPLDPRHRLVVPKYNPARVFTPEGAVGIGGCYMCIYPMESPGGYQLLGRTLSMWNTFGRVEPFSVEKPWFLDFFDQVRFFPVSEDELEQTRKDFKGGKYKVKIEQGTLRMKEYNAMVSSITNEIKLLKERQKAANAEQNALDAIILKKLAEAAKSEEKENNTVEDGNYDDPKYIKVDAQVSGSTWDVSVEVGQRVEEGQTLVILEAMKMEYSINAPLKGIVRCVKVAKSDLVTQGSTLAVLEIDP